MATIILIHELGLPLDEIVFAEVMFDKKKGVSGENVEHLRFMKQKAIPLFESWGYKVTIVRAEKDYLDMFYHVIKNPRKNMENEGKYYGFPLNKWCVVKRDLKIKPVAQYLESLNEPYVQYMGICADEPARILSMEKQKNAMSLLAQLGYTQQMARQKCEEYDLLSPLYNYTNRGGCWFCAFAKPEEHRAFREENPEAWERFVLLETEENVAYDKWNVFGTTLQERDRLLNLL